MKGQLILRYYGFSQFLSKQNNRTKTGSGLLTISQKCVTHVSEWAKYARSNSAVANCNLFLVFVSHQKGALQEIILWNQGTADDNISFSGYRREICGRGPGAARRHHQFILGISRLPCAIRCTRERRAEWVPTLRDFAANSVVLLPPSSMSGRWAGLR